MGEKVYDNGNKKKGFLGFGKKKNKEEVEYDESVTFQQQEEEEIPFEELLNLDQEVSPQEKHSVIENKDEEVSQEAAVEEPVAEVQELEKSVPEVSPHVENQAEPNANKETGGNLVNKYLALGLKEFKTIPGESLSYSNVVKPVQPRGMEEKPAMDQVDVIVRQHGDEYEVISMRPLVAAVVDVTDSEAQLIKADEQLKNRNDLTVTDKLALYETEAALLSSDEPDSRMKMLCNVSEGKSINEVMAELNDIPEGIMTNLLRATKLIPEMRQYLTTGLKMHEAAMIAELSKEDQHKVHGAIRKEGNANLEQEKVRETCSAIKRNHEITVDEIHETLFKERVYTLTESELKAIVDEMISQKLKDSQVPTDK